MENPPQTETSKSIFRNVLYGFSTWILPIGLSFIATPLIVRTLGNEEFGIYALIMGVVGYTFNLSFGRAVTKYIAEYRASGESEKIRDVLSASIFINTAVALTSFLIIYLSAEWLASDVFQIAAEDRQKSVTALRVAAAIIFSLVINQVFNSVLQGIHRFDIYSKILNFNNIAMLSGNIILAYYGFGIVSLLTWNLIINCLSGILYFLSAKRTLPEFGFDLKLKPVYLKLIFSYSAGIIIYQVLANILFLFERAWIYRQLGSENLTFYVIPMSLALYIHGFISSIILVIFPLASELKDNPEKLLRLYTKATKVVCFFVVFLGITLTVESEVLLFLWLGGDFAENSSMLLKTHAFTFSLLAIATVSWQMTEGLGYPSYNTIIYVIYLVINVCLMIGLTEEFGNMGVALGRLGGFVVFAFSVFYVEKWIFKRIQTEFWLNLVFKLFISAVFSSVVQKIIIDNFQISWLTFIGSIICSGFVYCLVLVILGFVNEEEKLLLKKLVAR